jgi:asparagine synthase (glutamine-hydrolysing)
MCGICGVVGGSAADIEPMLSVQAHRGPDDTGRAAFPLPDGREAVLGHLRLSILDPTPAGHQPMADASGRVHLTYNGELYNYPELRREVEARGIRLRSRCDTEVLVNLLALDGLGVVERLNGIFAFAAWDTESGELWLARDRAGTKPLYYAELPSGRLAFASEMKALVPQLSSRAVDPEALADYFTYLWVPGPRTVMRGIRKLEPAHVGVFADGRLRTTRYWSLRFNEETGRSDDNWVEELSATFRDAVRSQQLSDVPLGSFLSGGVDSSAVVAAMSTDDPVKTFAIGYGAGDLAHDVVTDDLPYARQVAAALGTRHQETVLDPDLAGDLPRVVWHMDEPVADPAALSALLICQAASEDLTVIMSGVGGDELFAGYPRHRAARIAGAVSPLRPLAGPLERRIGIGPPGRLRAPRRNFKKFLRGAALPPAARYAAYFSYFDEQSLGRLLAPLDVGGYDPLERSRDLYRAVPESPVNAMLNVDWHGFLPDLNLTYTDKMGMAASTEVRVPFLDNRMVDLAARMPADLKLRGLKQKWGFKESQRRHVPAEVIGRKKAGFGAPIRAWLAGPLAERVDATATDGALVRSGLVDMTAARSLVDSFRANREDNSLQIWALLTLDLWLETFVERPGTRGTPEPVAAIG